MIGVAKNDDLFMYHVKAEDFVPEDHPLRKIRACINTTAIRRLARPLYSPTGRPSIPPEHLLRAGQPLVLIEAVVHLCGNPQDGLRLRRPVEDRQLDREAVGKLPAQAW